MACTKAWGRLPRNWRWAMSYSSFVGFRPGPGDGDCAEDVGEGAYAKPRSGL
jgi:hypothetical protein